MNESNQINCLVEIITNTKKELEEFRTMLSGAHAREAGYQAALGVEQKKIRELEDRLADCAKQKDVGLSKTELDQYCKGREDERNEFLEHSNSQAEVIRELEKSLASARAECKMWDYQETQLRKSLDDLRKEKEHYESVAQESLARIGWIEKHGGYNTGKIDGRAEALAKVQDAVLKLRE